MRAAKRRYGSAAEFTKIIDAVTEAEAGTVFFFFSGMEVLVLCRWRQRWVFEAPEPGRVKEDAVSTTFSENRVQGALESQIEGAP